MKYKILSLILIVFTLSSCYKYIGSFNKSNEKYDQAIDFCGDGEYLSNLVYNKKMAWDTLLISGKTEEDIKDFLGFSLNDGIIYIMIDSRDNEGRVEERVIEEADNFKSMWKNGFYQMYGRKLNAIWLVYGSNEDEMMRLNGYYEGEGWYMYLDSDNTSKPKFFYPINDINLAPTLLDDIQKIVYRRPNT